MLYNIVLVPAIYQHESATDIHRFPPTGASLPRPTPFCPSTLSQGIVLSSLCYTANPLWLSILHMVTCICAKYTRDTLHSSHPLFSPLCPQSVLYVCLPLLLLPYKYVHEYHQEMIQINLLTEQKQTHRLQEQTSRCCCWGWGRMGERDSQGVWDGHVHMLYLKWVISRNPLIAQETAPC